MTRDLHAINARTLLETRRQGLMPAGPVFVALAGGNFPAPALYVRPDMETARLDWRALVDLQVQVWLDVKVPIDRLVDVVADVGEVLPRSLHVMFDHSGIAHCVDVGQGLHRAAQHDIPAEHSFLWLPVPTGGTTIARKLCRSLLRSKHGAMQQWN